MTPEERQKLINLLRALLEDVAVLEQRIAALERRPSGYDIGAGGAMFGQMR